MLCTMAALPKCWNASPRSSTTCRAVAGERNEAIVMYFGRGRRLKRNPKENDGNGASECQKSAGAIDDQEQALSVVIRSHEEQKRHHCRVRALRVSYLSLGLSLRQDGSRLCHADLVDLVRFRLAKIGRQPINIR